MSACRTLLAVIALAGSMIGSPIAAAAPPVELHAKPEVDLPFGDAITFPEGPGADAVSANCLTCHSADHTLNQPSLSKAEWRKVVDKMVTVYMAPITPADATAIVDYLTRIKGEP